MRAVWKGVISFGLINIPISLFAAARREELKFHLLRASDLSPVNYKRVAEADGKEVPWDQIVKGYEYEKGRYVVLKEEDFKRVDVEATQTVDIVNFVQLSEINPIFFHKPYYMEPTKSGQKAYALLREALQKEGKVGIAKVVIKTRQYLAAVKAGGSLLSLELMHFSDELMDSESLHLPAASNLRKNELDMATALIEQMTEPWDPEKHKDDYRSALLDLIEKKVAKGGRAVKTKKGKAPAATNIVDLSEVLRQSLRQTGKSSRRRKKSSSRSSRKKQAA